MTKKTAKKSKSSNSKGEKKGTSKKSAQNTQKDDLIKQLKKLINELNEEGLSFLIEQAIILKHNMQVKELNKDLQKLRSNKPKSDKTSKSDKHKIEVEEADDNSYFIIVMNRARNFFSLEEMRKLVKICHASEDEKDASRRLYNWFSKNRSDVIRDTDIVGVNDPALTSIYNYIKNKYTVKEGN